MTANQKENAGTGNNSEEIIFNKENGELKTETFRIIIDSYRANEPEMHKFNYYDDYIRFNFGLIVISDEKLVKEFSNSHNSNLDKSYLYFYRLREYGFPTGYHIRLSEKSELPEENVRVAFDNIERAMPYYVDRALGRPAGLEMPEWAQNI